MSWCWMKRIRTFETIETAQSCVTNKLVRSRTKSSSESEDKYAEQELSGLEEGENAMTDEEGEVEGEGEAGRAAEECEQAQRNKPTDRKRKNTKQDTCRSTIGAHTT